MRGLVARGGLLLTDNARAARALERRYAEDQRRAGSAVWRSPRILDVQSWLAEQWQQLLLTGTEDRILLNDLQEQATWTEILEPQLRTQSLLQPARFAQQARTAYALLADYDALARFTGQAWLADPHSEPEMFRGWARAFERRCQRERWIAACELPDAIARALRFGQLPAPAEVGWLGFDRLTPALVNLESALQAAGALLDQLSWPDRAPAEPRLLERAGEEDEVRACAAWAERQLLQQPQARIGILLPDVASRRASLERALFHALSPERFPITAGALPVLPFEFSLGQPLADVPLIHAALLLLRWLSGPLTQSEITWLLLSGALSWGAGAAARDDLARRDASARNAKSPAPQLSLEACLAEYAERGLGRKGFAALSAMQQQARRSTQPTRQARPGEWAERVQSWLRTAGWGTGGAASSLAFQANEAWQRLLEHIASLDHTAARLPYERFLAMLLSAARETIFAPESQDAPVQVMGVLAAAGQQFDAVWFLGATETAWPPPGRPHPLLPIALQREFEMPHASPAQDTALARAAFEHVVRSTPGEVVVSYAKLSGEAEQRASSLVTYYAPAESDEQRRSTAPTLELETVSDDTWVPLASAAAPGGQSALKQQADCPFQAFATRRLHARELPGAVRGLTAAERGTLVHDTLQRVWKEFETQSALVACWDAGTLEDLVRDHATAAVAELRRDQDHGWRTAYLDAEAERLVRLILDWLDLERKRAPFRVLEVEQKLSVEVGGLGLTLRLDRVDETDRGRLILDYKTGEVSIKSWEGDRPEQPQLPLYAAFGGSEELAGALFAQVRPAKTRLIGRVNDPERTLGLAADKNLQPLTDGIIAEWRTALEQLAHAFRDGEARVDPHRYPATCRYCDLPGLCRVAEHRPAENDDSGDEENAPTA